MEKLTEVLESFFSKFYKNDILEAVREGRNFIVINYSLLERFDSEVADMVITKPQEFLDKANEVVRDEAVKGSYEEAEKIKIVVRIMGVPDSHKLRIRDLRHYHIGRMIKVDGLVKRASDVTPQVEEAVFECSCGNQIRILQKRKLFTYPEYCENCGKREKFKVIDRKLFDVRGLRLEDILEDTMGERPGQVTIILKDDLTTKKMQKKTDPGTRLRITGVLREHHKVDKGGAKTVDLEMFIDVNFVESIDVDFDELEITENDVEDIHKLAKSPDVYERLVKSLAPSMYGMDEVKESIILQMFGGVPDSLPDGIKIRGDIHILLVGDPSVGKTQLLTLAASIVPRGRYVSGKGSSAAGLTATVVKDNEFVGGWVLEAGAMVLSNKGVICIDEFDKMSEEDQVNLHEAMSKQTVSIAKATISATLPAQTSVIAGANPKFSRFDPYKSMADQIDIPDTLLSRFDLKFVLRDVASKEMDEKMVEHIIRARLVKAEASPEIETSLLKKFIAYARQNSKPVITEKAARMMKEFYINLRENSGGRDAIPITLRQYEALIRLAQAAAKVRLDTEVREEDALRSIRLMEYSIRQLGFDPATGKIDIDKTEARVSSSQRNAIMSAMDVVLDLTSRHGNQIPRDELIRELEGQGHKSPEQIVNKLLREGEIYEPKPGFISKLR